MAGTLTKEQWTQIEKALSGLYGNVKLRIEGHEIILRRSRVSENKLGIGVFVDGELKGAWMGQPNDCPEQKFMFPSKRYVWTAKSRQDMKRLIKRHGKRKAKELFGCGDPDEKITVFMPFVTSAKTAIRHYKTFADIELLEVTGC